MNTVRLMLTGSDGAARRLIAALGEVDGISRIEELDPQLPQLDDADSSSLGLEADGTRKVHVVEVDASDAEATRRVHVAAESSAIASGAVIEVDEQES
jgi:hypothetical protein